MPQRFHYSHQALKRDVDSGPGCVPFEYRMRNVVLIYRRRELTGTVVMRNAKCMKIKIWRHILCADPFNRTRSRIKCVHGQAKFLDQFKVKRNVLADAERIHHAVFGKICGIHAPLGAFVAKTKSLEAYLDALPYISPTKRLA